MYSSPGTRANTHIFIPHTSRPSSLDPADSLQSALEPSAGGPACLRSRYQVQEHLTLTGTPPRPPHLPREDQNKRIEDRLPYTLLGLLSLSLSFKKGVFVQKCSFYDCYYNYCYDYLIKDLYHSAESLPSGNRVDRMKPSRSFYLLMAEMENALPHAPPSQTHAMCHRVVSLLHSGPSPPHDVPLVRTAGGPHLGASASKLHHQSATGPTTHTHTHSTHVITAFLLYSPLTLPHTVPFKHIKRVPT